jgi:hypothetical protein
MDSINQLMTLAKKDAGINTLLVIYSLLVVPNLPRSVLQMMDGTLVKVMLLVLAVFLFNKKMWLTAGLVLISYGMSMYMLSKHHHLDVENTVPLDAEYQGETHAVQWDSHDGINRFRHHGKVYEHQDVTNLLPGGHGNMLYDM